LLVDRGALETRCVPLTCFVATAWLGPQAWRIVRRALLVLAIAAATVAGAAEQAEATFPGRNGLIAFRGTFGCPGEQSAVGLIRRDGQQRRMVTPCDEFWHTPDWSPDGASFLTSNDREIQLIDAATLTARSVTRGSAPSFAPDGDHFAFRRARFRQLWRARVDGTHERLLRTGERNVREPLWSPARRTIAYHQDDVGTWLVSARTGRRIRKVTGSGLVPFDWSPDGRELLCGRRRAEGGYSDLYVVRAHGKGSPRRVTRTAGKSEGPAAWSPDGHRLVVLVTTPARLGYFRRAMVTMRTNGTHTRRLWRTPPVLEDETVAQNINLPLSAKWQPLP
jgi:Tol biopolymer transport system component